MSVEHHFAHGLPSVDERADFMSRLDRRDGCWLWRSTKSPGRYGVFRWRGRVWGAHRLALIWESSGVEQLNMMALHACRNTNCCFPDHLRWGTPKENMRDKVRDGTVLFGEKIANARLNGDLVRSLFIEYHNGSKSIREVAEKYNLHPDHTKDIINGDTWRRHTAVLIVDKIRTGKELRKRLCAKFSTEAIRLIWDDWHVLGMQQKQIAEKHGCTRGEILSILRRKTYASDTVNLVQLRPTRQVSSPTRKLSGTRHALKKSQIAEIWLLAHHGQDTIGDIAKRYNITERTAWDVVHRHTHKKFSEGLSCLPAPQVCRYCLKASIS